MEKTGSRLLALVLAFIIVVFGFLIFSSGYSVVHREWGSVGSAFAACAITWMLADLVMMAAGAWVLGSAGGQRIPLWLSGAAAAVAGTSLVVGVLTHVVPCSGPS